jgi:hypothetical protein
VPQPKPRPYYPAARTKPPRGWKPPRRPLDVFECAALHCRLTAEACLKRQAMMIRGTPEPRWAYCHHCCVQGERVDRAMPAAYEVPRVNQGEGRSAARRKARRKIVHDATRLDPLEDIATAVDVSPRVSAYESES